jgi:predicted dehydrogenase
MGGRMDQAVATKGSGTLRLAAVGLGFRAAHMVRMMCAADPDVRLAGVADPSLDVVRDRVSAGGVRGADDLHFFHDADELVKHAGDFDGVVIGTRCNLHTPLAVKLAATGLPVFLEKPVAVSWDQVDALRAAYAGREAWVVVSFPLRLTVHVQTALNIVRSGRIGTVNQIQAVNNVPYGGVYFGQWYRDYETTGGLWLQKATHDFDYITQLMDACPTQVTAVHTRRAYGGTMPPELTCSKCAVTETCRESPQNLRARDGDGGIMPNFRDAAADHACAFSTSVLHQDAGSALILYDNGAHASYSQNFVSRRSAGRRGATITGYDGTVQFDWQSETLRVIDHHRDRVEEVSVRTTGGHGGGDEVLARNFIDVLRGRDVSHSPLTDGLLSAAMCLAARDSAAQRRWQTVPAYGRAPRDYPKPVIEPSR